MINFIKFKVQLPVYYVDKVVIHKNNIQCDPIVNRELIISDLLSFGID